MTWHVYLLSAYYFPILSYIMFEWEDYIESSYPMTVDATQPMETMIRIPEVQLQKSMTSFEFPNMERLRVPG